MQGHREDVLAADFEAAEEGSSPALAAAAAGELPAAMPRPAPESHTARSFGLTQ